ncbi:hypothetical protein Dimus_012402 [Dionaea muscipula]
MCQTFSLLQLFEIHCANQRDPRLRDQLLRCFEINYFVIYCFAASKIHRFNFEFHCFKIHGFENPLLRDLESQVANAERERGGGEMRGRGRGGGGGGGKRLEEASLLTRMVSAVFAFVRLAEFEILFVLFFLIAFLIFKDLGEKKHDVEDLMTAVKTVLNYRCFLLLEVFGNFCPEHSQILGYMQGWRLSSVEHQCVHPSADRYRHQCGAFQVPSTRISHRCLAVEYHRQGDYITLAKMIL